MSFNPTSDVNKKHAIAPVDPLEVLAKHPETKHAIVDYRELVVQDERHMRPAEVDLLIGDYSNWPPIGKRHAELIQGTTEISRLYGVEMRYLGFQSHRFDVHDQTKRAVAEAVPDGRYVETPGVSHISIDPDSLQVQMTALLEFLDDR
ncbi:MAG: hypothetical protein HC794_08165 [Nitrospiraceae bacterium]|nr:hypothetical protein [Nitrospiraceae bacterium]